MSASSNLPSVARAPQVLVELTALFLANCATISTAWWIGLHEAVEPVHRFTLWRTAWKRYGQPS